MVESHDPTRFDPLDHTLAKLVNFCKRLELTEPEVKKKSSFKNESSSSSSGKNRKVGFQRDRNSNLKGDCLLHGNNCCHNTDECCMMKRHAEAVKKKYSNNIGHINSNREVQTIFNEEFMNFMDNKKKRKGKKPSKCSEKELKNFEELKLDESSSDNSDHKMFSSDSDSSDDD